MKKKLEYRLASIVEMLGETAEKLEHQARKLRDILNDLQQDKDLVETHELPKDS